MPDNTTLSAGTGDGDTYRARDRAGVKTSVISLDLNPAGSESLMSGSMPINDDGGSLTVDGTVAVTGTFWQATQPVSLAAGLTVDNAGTFAVQAAQDGAWTVTADAGSGTFAVSAASLPLPSGAATSAKQPAIGTAGTASTDVITVQGVASMTALKVDGSGVTQPVSGTFWQATQPVSGTVTANVGTGTQPVSGTFWQATQPVSAASLPLPAGAATAAKQPALGTAGTASTDVITVQGIASGTAQPVSGTFWQATQPVSLASLPALVAGTANIGDVDVLTLPAIPAGANLIGKVSGSSETDAIYSGSTALTPKFAAISASSSGDNSVVAAVVGKKIRVLRWGISANGAVNAKWRRATTDISGLHYLTQFASAGGAFCPVGHFETGTNEALQINLSGAVAVGGVLTYVEV